MDNFIETLNRAEGERNFSGLDHLTQSLMEEFNASMDDDLNISGALSCILKKIKEINILVDNKYIDADGAEQILRILQRMDSVLKIFSFIGKDIDPDTRKLMEKREEARRGKNWALADEIRLKLEARGVDLRDKKL